MKAAVLHEIGGTPRYEEFPDPVAEEGEVVVEVLAVAVENVDKAVFGGRHYASGQYAAEPPLIPGIKGVGRLPDGALVGFADPRSPYGALAERTVVAADSVAPIPDGLDPAVSLVLGSALTGMSVSTAAGLSAGETVLVQGATGVAGRLAVQVARLLGAGRVVATGRDPQGLRDVRDLGADEVIDLTLDDDALAEAFTAARGDGYDIVADFLWGRPTEVLLRTLVPGSFAFGKPTRIVQIGASAGPDIRLTGDSLRTSGVEIYGAAKGLDAEAMAGLYARVVAWARAGELRFALERTPLSAVEAAWRRTVKGARLVIVPDASDAGAR